MKTDGCVKCFWEMSLQKARGLMLPVMKTTHCVLSLHYIPSICRLLQNPTINSNRYKHSFIANLIRLQKSWRLMLFSYCYCCRFLLFFCTVFMVDPVSYTHKLHIFILIKRQLSIQICQKTFYISLFKLVSCLFYRMYITFMLLYESYIIFIHIFDFIIWPEKTLKESFIFYFINCIFF